MSVQIECSWAQLEIPDALPSEGGQSSTVNIGVAVTSGSGPNAVVPPNFSQTQPVSPASNSVIAPLLGPTRSGLLTANILAPTSASGTCSSPEVLQPPTTTDASRESNLNQGEGPAQVALRRALASAEQTQADTYLAIHGPRGSWMFSQVNLTRGNLLAVVSPPWAGGFDPWPRLLFNSRQLAQDVGFGAGWNISIARQVIEFDADTADVVDGAGSIFHYVQRAYGQKTPPRSKQV